jgi:RNA polymerase sigma factor (sigma-70 family)
VETVSTEPTRVALSAESWDDLFDFLDPTRQQKAASDRDALAESMCLALRSKLVCFFAGRGCPDAEDLAMDTLLRVAARCRNLDSDGYVDRTGYFYGVARNVLHEWQRQSAGDVTKRESLRIEFLRLPIPDPHSWAQKEALHRYLEGCLAKLTERARRLILSYYCEERAAKIEHHRALAGEFGKSVNSLRIEVHRIRKGLRECLYGCLQPHAEGAGRGAG